MLDAPAFGMENDLGNGGASVSRQRSLSGSSTGWADF
jgi:hypothetical protein